MPKCCIICSIVASLDLQLQYCDQCQSAVYCSRTCQRIDWKKQHRGICKLLNVGHGDRQVRNGIHTSRNNDAKEAFESSERSLDEGKKRFFKRFQESTFEGSQAAAQKMKKYAKRQTKMDQKCLLIHCLCFLIRSKSEMLSWPNSPLLVMLHFVDPNVQDGDKEMSLTPLHHLADLADPFDYSTHENQLILAKQLIERGANVNAVSFPKEETPLHKACSWFNVTNLDFVAYLLEEGADPNARDYCGRTPLMCTTKLAPGAAKFLLNLPATDVNILYRNGESFLSRVRFTITTFSDEQVARPDNPDKVQDQFLRRQWREIEEMLVEMEAADTAIPRTSLNVLFP
jgi:CRISPR/Cas system-associated endoribonuclease Cas2